jgi:hypothetical protein
MKATVPERNIPGSLLTKIAIVRRFPLKYWPKVFNTAEITPAEIINPYPIRRIETVEVYKLTSSALQKSEHNMHHRIVLPSENGRKPNIQARPRSDIIT